MQHSHREHPGCGATGRGVVQNEKRTGPLAPPTGEVSCDQQLMSIFHVRCFR